MSVSPGSPGSLATDPDQLTLDRQQEQWAATYGRRADFLGAEPSEPARRALERFQAAGLREILELGPGQGRDTLLFARAGLRVLALDYAAEGLAAIRHKAEAEADGLAPGLIEVRQGDVRGPLPLADASIDACYAHMLFCMALTTPELERLADEVRRVLRPGGLLVYTVRNKLDAHYGAGVGHGDDLYEMGGFIVHFFDRGLIERLAAGFELLEVAEYEEGRLPRRLYGVTQRRA
jgi:SAM-dependent methyltransferase